MSAAKQIILITGGNSGIGFETAAQLIQATSKHVIICSRSLEKGETALKDLQSRKEPGSIELVQLDVTSVASIEAAARRVESEHGKLDVLINNAGVGIGEGSLEQQMMNGFKTNCLGPVMMVDAFTPLLKKCAGTPRIINVSSGAGSIALRLQLQGRGTEARKALTPYRTSKAALNMASVDMAVLLGEEIGCKVFTYCPGFTASNFGPGSKVENGASPTRDSALPIVRMALGEYDADHGKFLARPGHPFAKGEPYLPW